VQLLETAKIGLRRVLASEVFRLRFGLKAIARKEPEDPDEPCALVGALKKPRTPLRSSAAAAPLHFEEPGQ